MTMPTDIEIVDLGIGFPYTSVEQKMGAYDFFRANLKDAQSVREMEFPVQYMFKGVPDIVPDTASRPVFWMRPLFRTRPESSIAPTLVRKPVADTVSVPVRLQLPAKVCAALRVVLFK